MTERERERLAAYAMGDPSESGEYPEVGSGELARLVAVVAALQAEAAYPPLPPPGLAAATVARLPVTTPGRLARAGRHWLADNLATAASIAAGVFVAAAAAGLFASAVQKVRRDSRQLACRDQLRGLHFALDGYAEAHAARYPAVGAPGLPVAGELGAELARAGHDGSRARCPAGGPYAYTLGYRSGGGLFGVRLGEGDATPVAADAAPAAHGVGRNVLYAGGAVLFTTTPAVGPGGDDIFTNQLGEPHAGLHRADASLGGAGAFP